MGKIKWILCSDWLPERAKWAYLARSGLPTLVLQKRNSVGVIFWPYHKSFIDQACSVKMAGYLPRPFLRFYGPGLRLGPLKRKKRTWPISSHLDRTSLVNKAYIYQHYNLLETPLKYALCSCNSKTSSVTPFLLLLCNQHIKIHDLAKF